MTDGDTRTPGDPTPDSASGSSGEDDTGPAGPRDPSTAAPPNPPPPEPSSDPSETSDRQARDWAMGVHLAGLSSLVGIPGIVGVLVIWLVKRDEYPLVDENGKEALNFQISLFIYTAVAFVLSFLLIGIPLLVVLWIVGLVFPVVAGIKTNDGEEYRYPLTIRLVD